LNKQKLLRLGGKMVLK